MPKPNARPSANARNSHKPHASSRPFFRAAMTPAGELEILIYEEIGEYFDWDTYSMAGTTAKSVRQSIDAAGTFSKIKVRINSPGGDAFEGVAIGNVLKASGKQVEVYIDGIAASAASIIAMCGSPITMASNAMMMIHKAWSMCVGNADDMLKMADSLNAVDSGAIAQTYVDRTGKPMDEILAMMSAETWLSARECVEQGFANAIADQPNEGAVAMARGFKVLAQMKRVPENLRNKAKNDDMEDADKCECDCAACMDGDCPNCSNAECDDANCTDCPMQAGTENAVELPAAAIPPVDIAASEAISEVKRARLKLAARRRAA